MDNLKFQNVNKMYISFLIGLILGLMATFIRAPAFVGIPLVFIVGLFCGFIYGKNVKVGMINGLISSFGYPIASLIFYTVRSIEGFPIPIIPIIMRGLILMLIVLGLLGAVGGLTGSYIKKKLYNK